MHNPWLGKNIIRNLGPLGALYPRLADLMQGDTPSFLGLVNNGLGWSVSPAYGGRGGRYALYQAYGETRPIWTNNRESRDAVTGDSGPTQCTDRATNWRWREHCQHDFAARMDWCVADDDKKANHNPVPVLNGDTTRGVLELVARPGDSVKLFAAGTKDPDGDAFSFTWFIYREAATFTGEVNRSAHSDEPTSLAAPAVRQPATLPVILQVQDRGVPSLFAYRRAVVRVSP